LIIFVRYSCEIQLPCCASSKIEASFCKINDAGALAARAADLNARGGKDETKKAWREQNSKDFYGRWAAR